MKSFSGWLESKNFVEYSTLGTEFVDETQIDAAYDKAKISVKLVQLYSRATSQKLLHNISTIATLNQSAYGLYNSGENKRVINPSTLAKIRLKFGQDVMLQNKLNNIPTVVLKQYFPDLKPNEVQPSDVIRVNVQKILNQYGDSLQAVLEIASTIVHEATHEIERETTGKTSEIGPQAAEKKFINWFSTNKNLVFQRIPELKVFA